jgi:hypothetical protein
LSKKCQFFHQIFLPKIFKNHNIGPSELKLSFTFCKSWQINFCRKLAQIFSSSNLAETDWNSRKWETKEKIGDVTRGRLLTNLLSLGLRYKGTKFRTHAWPSQLSSLGT